MKWNSNSKYCEKKRMGVCCSKEHIVNVKTRTISARRKTTSLCDLIEEQNSKREKKLRPSTIIRRKFMVAD